MLRELAGRSCDCRTEYLMVINGMTIVQLFAKFGDPKTKSRVAMTVHNAVYGEARWKRPGE